MPMNRHVIKYLLGRKSGFHDLAFFDPDMYESLRQLIVDAKNQVINLFWKDFTSFCLLVHFAIIIY
jgi:hypothetical protein